MTTTVNHQLGFLTGGMQERAPDQGRIRGPNEKAAAPALLQPGERLSYNRKFLDEKRVGVKKKTSGRYFDKGCLRNAVMTDGLPIMGLPVWFRGNEAPPKKNGIKCSIVVKTPLSGMPGICMFPRVLRRRSGWRARRTISDVATRISESGGGVETDFLPGRAA